MINRDLVNRVREVTGVETTVTQSQLAQRIGMSQTAISKFLATGNCGETLARQLARHYPELRDALVRFIFDVDDVGRGRPNGRTGDATSSEENDEEKASHAST